MGKAGHHSEVGDYTTSKLVSDIVCADQFRPGGRRPRRRHGPRLGGRRGLCARHDPPRIGEPPDHRQRRAPRPVPTGNGQRRGAISSVTIYQIHQNRHIARAIGWQTTNVRQIGASLFSADMGHRMVGRRTARKAYKTEWLRPGRLQGMTNWYRASPLKVAEPGTPLSDPPKLPLDKLRIHCDHLLIWGMKDTAVLQESAEGLEDFCAKLTRVEFADADHWILHQQPDEVAEAIVDWVIGDDNIIP